MSRGVVGVISGLHRMVALGAAGACLLAGTAAPAGAQPHAASGTPTAATSVDTAAELATAARHGRWRTTSPLYREVVRRGDQDGSPRNIEHVRELQYRLRFAGVYRGPVTGLFGDLTHAAVRRYQKREKLQVSGVATHLTWAHLIKDSMRGGSKLRRKCIRGDGNHACYDRQLHQLTLWRNGRLRNAWLVRGGMRGYETRVGNFRVFRRDKRHVSSIYGSPMPYSQFFSGGQAFHGSTYMTDPFAGHSHGCINMYIEDARQLWALTSRKPLAVHVYGSWD
ncbi:MAG: hypothetical protein AVDCRST_MAG29-245 [uncultured Nocardioidaceae bacterium]|uniref:L,D-TPase catalytic domain-containing protein n=1 Tax=uncultured Nocardioidaceae bacterium TaxID=253824 RepID=A0A6J4L353_9ACTN|nr:MAG: hypothetical protein AVDCRST_MAG29-245 [uncultured Nocardioidaceae bacterium]